jgi:hypothetical protein
LETNTRRIISMWGKRIVVGISNVVLIFDEKEWMVKLHW